MPVYREPGYRPPRPRRKRRRTPVLSTAERRAASRSTRRAHLRTPERRTPLRRLRRQTRRRALTRRARAVGVPTRVLGVRKPPVVLRPEVRQAERTQRQIKRATRRYIRKAEREADTPGIFERGLIGSAVYEGSKLFGDEPVDISDDVRRVFYGTEDPNAAQLALALAPIPVAKGAGLVLRGGRAAKGVVSGSHAATRVRGAARSARAATTGRATARLAKSKGGRAALKTGRVAKGTAKVGAKTATFPIRHPLKTTKYSVYAQAPVALSTGDPSQLAAPFRGEGVVAAVTKPVSAAVSSLPPGEIASNLVKDVLELPANTPPAIYLPLAGIVEAAQGDSSRLEGLWEDYKETGLLPAIAEGDLDKVKESIKSHPLFAALEVRGVQAVAGRAAGAALRRAPSDRLRRVAGTEREALQLPGALEPQPRRFSPDLIEKGVQVLRDRRRERRQGGQIATPKQVDRILRERAHRLPATLQGTSRMGREDELRAVGEAQPARKIDREGVALAARRIIRSPQTFAEDLTSYARSLDREAAAMAGEIRTAASASEKASIRVQLRENEAMRNTVDRLLRDGDPEAIFRSAEANVGPLRTQTAELEEIGLLGEGQGTRAAAMDFAVRHMGARAGKPTGGGREQLLDANGNPLPTRIIEAEMRRQGVDPAGFITQRPGSLGRGSFYRAPFPNRPSLPKARKTGEATRRGTFDPAYETIRQQRARNQQIISGARNFTRIISEFAATRTRYGNRDKAQEVVRNPEIAGLPPGMRLVAVRLSPYSASKRERGKAEEAFERLDPEDTLAVEMLGDDLITKATQDGPGPWAVVPEVAFNELRENFRPAAASRRAAQLVSQTFKGAVLPLSPNWYLSNFLDINMRAALEGTTPYGMNASLARRYLRELEKVDPQTAAEMRAGVTPGMIFGRAMRDEYHRTAEQFAGTRLEGLANVLARVRRAPVARTVLDGWRDFRDGAFRFEDWFIERRGQQAMLGKAIREQLRETKGTWRAGARVTDDALREFIGTGKLGTPKQIALAKRVERAMGQWTANSPAMRQLLVDYLPFGQWLRASARFVYHTLPRHHPIKVGIAAAVAEMTQEEREQLGLSYFAEEGRLPPQLMGSIPTSDGGLLPIQGMTTLGQFAAPFSPTGLPGFLLPQAPIYEMAGLDWTGKELTHEDGTPLNQDERAAAAFLAGIEVFIPASGTLTRVTGFDPLGAGEEAQGLTGVVPRGLRPYDPGLVEYLRSLSGSRNIQVPAKKAQPQPSSGNPYSLGDSGTSEGNPYILGGSGTTSDANPYLLR